MCWIVHTPTLCSFHGGETASISEHHGRSGPRDRVHVPREALPRLRALRAVSRWIPPISGAVLVMVGGLSLVSRLS